MADGDSDDIRARVSGLMPMVRSDLENLVRIPSISFPGYDAEPMRLGAEATREVLARSGAETRLLEVRESYPGVFAHFPGPGGAPRVLLYAHYDVQPPGSVDSWSSGPFEPVERNGRLFGRGAADNKAGVMVHACALRVWSDRLPVAVSVFIEGEEESNSEHLPEFLEEYGSLLGADLVVVADGMLWDVGEPALTVSLRGITACIIEVKTLYHAVHSGDFGGPVPDALMVLVRALARLHDDRGNVAVPRLAASSGAKVPLTEATFREWAGTRPGVELIGDGTLTERLWNRPALSILGIDAPRVHEAPNQLVSQASAKVSLRIPPGQDPEQAREALLDHIKSSVPWGAEVRITPLAASAPYAVGAGSLGYDAMRRGMAEAWGRTPIDMGVGGSVPFVSAYASAFPEASLLITGAGDPHSNVHGEDESVDLLELERSCLAEALFLQYLAW